MTQTEEALPSPDSDDTITPELIAKTIAGIPLVGCARNALLEAGYTATIVANRITIERQIEAQLLSTNGKSWWNVYASDGTPPVWTVGAQLEPNSNWIGAVE